MKEMNELGNTPADKNYKPSGISRAEERALEAYPVYMQQLVYQDLIEQFGGKTEIDVNTYPRHQFQEGYEQAEKDLALTLEDVKRVVEIADMLCPYAPKDIAEFQAEFQTEDAYYREVLERFNKGREEKE